MQNYLVLKLPSSNIDSAGRAMSSEWNYVFFQRSCFTEKISMRKKLLGRPNLCYRYQLNSTLDRDTIWGWEDLEGDRTAIYNGIGLSYRIFISKMSRREENGMNVCSGLSLHHLFIVISARIYFTTSLVYGATSTKSTPSTTTNWKNSLHRYVQAPKTGICIYTFIDVYISICIYKCLYWYRTTKTWTTWKRRAGKMKQRKRTYFLEQPNNRVNKQSGNRKNLLSSSFI